MAGILRGLRRRLSAIAWAWVTRREFCRTTRLKKSAAAERRKLQSALSDVESRLRQHEVDARHEEERLSSQIAILTEQLAMYADIVQRERQRVAAETAILARRESDAKFSGTPGAAAGGFLEMGD